MHLPHFNNSNEESNHPILTHKKKLTFSQRAADAMTNSMGSWWFIFVFLILLGIWMALNMVAWMHHWDPYPFILLNLALSMISALQAPIIMMSQNRQTERDRIAAKYDYAVNRKIDREVQNMQKDLEEIKTLLAGLSTKTRKK